MSFDFIDLTLGELDAAASFQRSGQFWEKAFRLSGEVPEEWADLFAEIWEGAQFDPKRHAWVENGCVITICLPPETQGELMQYLVAAVDRTNNAYRAQIGPPEEA